MNFKIKYQNKYGVVTQFDILFCTLPLYNEVQYRVQWINRLISLIHGSSTGGPGPQDGPQTYYRGMPNVCVIGSYINQLNHPYSGAKFPNVLVDLLFPSKRFGAKRAEQEQKPKITFIKY